MTLAERLNPATYKGDEPVGVAAVPRGELPGPISDEKWRYIPERVWNRILHLGAAYELHYAATLEPVIDTVLDSTQWESMEPEFRFISEVVGDHAVRSALSVIVEEGQKVSGRPAMALVLSPP